VTELPIPVLAGAEPPEHWDDIEARQREHGEQAAPWLRSQRRPAIAKPDLDWSAFGFEPRWVGSDTAACVVALQPSIYAGHGADEFARFRQGAAGRCETALVISPIGDLDGESRDVRSVFGPPASSVTVGQTHTNVNGRLLGKEASVRLAADLGDADGDLARRLLSCSQALRWRSLSLSGAVLESINGRQQYPAEGALSPILETELGEPVVAVWVSPDYVERRYIVPVETPWPLLLDWLREQAVPEFVPEAMHRARRQLGTEVHLMSRAERAARSALGELEADYIARKKELEHQLEDVVAAASTIREGLLYGTGQRLVDAVSSVLKWAGITVVDLDEKLGGTKNADLLCTYRERSRLVEVKSAGGSAPERAYQDLVRHLREWPSLPESVPVDGGALILNHEHRSAPGDRTRRPYSRPEFLAAQAEPVIPTLSLFDAWREEDPETIRRLLFVSTFESIDEAPSREVSRGESGTPGRPETGSSRQFRWGRKWLSGST
jgi:hypothetical protein